MAFVRDIEQIDADNRARTEGMFDTVLEALRPFSDEQLLYLPNPGNAGDSLIACATRQLLGRHGFSFVNITAADDVTGRVVLMGGGGNLNRLVEFGRRRQRDLRLNQTGVRIEDVAEPPGGTGNLLAADEMVNRSHDMSLLTGLHGLADALSPNKPRAQRQGQIGGSLH